MLANRLNVLLAERQLSIKQIVNDTAISRNAISNIINNPVANIATDTIDKLCNYLDVTPAEFFLYAPYSISLYEDSENRSVIYITVIHNHQEFMYLYNVYAFNDDYGSEDKTRREKYDLYLDVGSDDSKDDFVDIYNQLPVGFQSQITAAIYAEIEKKLSKENVLNVSWSYRDEIDMKAPEEISFSDFSKRLKKTTVSVSVRLPWRDDVKTLDLKKTKFI